jgi:ATP-dependent DNA helicase RecG
MSENQNIEYKQSWRDEYLKWVCGFANASGGKIYIGKDDSGEVVGVSDFKSLLVDIPNKVKDILGIMVDVNLFSEGILHFLEIVITPYPYPINYKGQYYYRSGSSKLELKGASLNKFLMEKIGKRWDGIPIPECKLSDLNNEIIIEYKEKASRSGRIYSEVLKDTNEILLENLHLLENKIVKRAAILLFHKQPEKYIQGAYIKIGFFQEDDDLVFQDEVHGSLIEQIDKTNDLLKTKYTANLISYSVVNRVEESLFPEFSVREALLNAIAHKDYSDGTPIQISVYSDHIVFWNPGQLPENWTVEYLMKKHPSKPFNPDVANSLFRCGYIEAWGRGTLKMIRESVEKHTLPPIFNFDYSGFMVTLFKDAASLMSKEGVPDNLIKIVEFVLKNGNVKNKDVQELLSVSKATASRLLKELDGKWLEREGETGRGTKYVIKGLIKG